MVLQYVRAHADPVFASTLSPWDNTPTELQICIFAQCRLEDILSLRLVCQAFLQTVDLNEHELVRQHLEARHQCSHPKEAESPLPYHNDSPDHLAQLSDLFPPPRSRNGIPHHSFAYLHHLKKRHSVCSQLSFYLAESVLRVHMGHHRSLGAEIMSKFTGTSTDLTGTRLLQSRLYPSM